MSFDKTFALPANEPECDSSSLGIFSQEGSLVE